MGWGLSVRSVMQWGPELPVVEMSGRTGGGEGRARCVGKVQKQLSTTSRPRARGPVLVERGRTGGRGAQQRSAGPSGPTQETRIAAWTQRAPQSQRQRLQAQGDLRHGGRRFGNHSTPLSSPEPSICATTS